MDRAAAFNEYLNRNTAIGRTEAYIEFQQEFPEPKPFDFIGQALCTKSDKFYGENVQLSDFLRAIGDVIVAGNKLDAIKKALFYGKPYPKSDERNDNDCQQIAINWVVGGDYMPKATAIDIIHAIIGKATEAVEGLELLHKTLQTKVFDPINAKEETFDGQWYDAILCNAIGITFEDGQRNIIDKLRKRFGDKFNEYDANNRDLTAEREVLEIKIEAVDLDVQDAYKWREIESHLRPIYNALHTAFDASKSDADKTYWKHEINALQMLMKPQVEPAQAQWTGDTSAELQQIIGRGNRHDSVELPAEPEPERLPRQFIGNPVNPAPVCGDADFLRSLARTMTYNGTESEAATKHRLHEIAMKLEHLEKA